MLDLLTNLGFETKVLINRSEKEVTQTYNDFIKQEAERIADIEAEDGFQYG